MQVHWAKNAHPYTKVHWTSLQVWHHIYCDGATVNTIMIHNFTNMAQ